MKKNILFVFSLLSLVSCQYVPAKITPTEESRLEKWKEGVHKVSTTDINVYDDQVFKIEPSGVIIEGAKAVADYYTNKKMKIDSCKQRYSAVATRDSSVVYDISDFWLKDQGPYTMFQIWQRSDSIAPYKIVLELAGPSKLLTEVPLGELAIKRMTWEKFCNGHRVDSLVSQVYDTAALYYNHRPLIKGTQALTDEYSYMNKATYNLSLVPLYIQAVDEHMVFEIGQGQGSYNGKYVLVWKKINGNWLIFLDSNY